MARKRIRRSLRVEQTPEFLFYTPSSSIANVNLRYLQYVAYSAFLHTSLPAVINKCHVNYERYGLWLPNNLKVETLLHIFNGVFLFMFGEIEPICVVL